ncbi:cold shock domain-containing protein [Kribbella sp. NPDC004875]|uniref:cold shock domain-containing protein n=1 Tax=Kribbella sp. NPDC004875 TaxID=3364107 RepID=UPI0036808E96
MDRRTGEDYGFVRFWHEEEGWGVIDCPSTPGGCWTHYSVIEADGYRSLTEGATVRVRWENPGQDGYDYRADWVKA